MKEKLMQNKTVVIIVAAVLVAAIGFGAGMAIHTAIADEGGEYISAEEAKTIALESVGVSPEKATFTKVRMDKNEYPAVYEIDFYTSAHEYDFEIDAKDGAIIEKDSEKLNTTKNAEMNSTEKKHQDTPTIEQHSKGSPDGQYIGVSKAKNIALSHAGLSAGKVTFTSTKLDSDDGVKVYEIDFIAGNNEYEYDIHAISGSVISYDIERMDDD